jgi:hypothetical protein
MGRRKRRKRRMRSKKRRTMRGRIRRDGKEMESGR